MITSGGKRQRKLDTSPSVLRKRRRPAFSPATRVSSAGYFCQTALLKVHWPKAVNVDCLVEKESF